MKTKAFALAFLLLLIIPQIPFSQTTISIRLSPETGQDCEVASYIPTTPYPSYPDILARTGTYGFCFNIWRPLVKFNLNEIPAGSRIVSAFLSLYGNPGSPNNLHEGENESYIRKVTTEWDQNSVTWETQPDFSTVNEVKLHQSTSPTEDYLDIDITEMVRDMVREPESNFGFIIMNRIESVYKGLNFASSENSNINKRPKLDITYFNPIGIEPLSNEIPSEYKLSQNFPNPFNPVTNIKFDIPASSFVSVKIYNELGKEVSSLVNENMSAGSYQVQWDGSKSGSGIYFVKLQSENILLTKKIILLK